MMSGFVTMRRSTSFTLGRSPSSPVKMERATTARALKAGTMKADMTATTATPSLPPRASASGTPMMA